MDTRRKVSLISAAVMVLIALIAGFMLVGQVARWVDVFTIIGSSAAAGATFTIAARRAKQDKNVE